MSQVGSVTGSPQQSPKSSASNSRTSTPERRKSVGSNDGVGGTDFLTTPLVDATNFARLQVMPVDRLGSANRSPNADLCFSDVQTLQINSLLHGTGDESKIEGRRLSSTLCEKGMLPYVENDRRKESPSAEDDFGVHSPLPTFSKNLRRESTESNISPMSETANNLTPGMREIYKELRLGKNSSGTAMYANDDFVTRLNLETEQVVTSAVEYRDTLETRVSQQQARLDILGEEIHRKEASIATLVARQAFLEDQIGSLRESLQDKQVQLKHYDNLLDQSSKKYDSTKKLVEKLVVHKAALEIEKEALALEIRSLKQAITPEDANAIEEKISKKYQDGMNALAERLRTSEQSLSVTLTELEKERETSSNNEAAVNRLQESLEISQKDASIRARENAKLQNQIATLQRALEAQARTHAEQLARLKPPAAGFLDRSVKETVVSFAGNVEVIQDLEDNFGESGGELIDPSVSDLTRVQRAAKEDRKAALLAKKSNQNGDSADKHMGLGIPLVLSRTAGVSEELRSDAGSEKSVTHTELQANSKEARLAALQAKKAAKAETKK